MKQPLNNLNNFDYTILSEEDQKVYDKIIKYIQQIPSERIDYNHSYWQVSDDLFILIESHNKEFCNFFISLKHGYFSMQIGYENRSEFIFNRLIQTDEDIDNLIKALKSFLRNKITETLTYCNNKVTQCSYLIPLDNFDTDEYKIVSKFGICLPFFRKKEIEKKYMSWMY